MLEKYGHGGDLRTAAETFGRSADAFLDFSSNMNPFWLFRMSSVIFYGSNGRRWRRIRIRPCAD
ncbi:hypothetical protein ACHHV8_26560 [Paenibacillus sp. TAB 01]|uniref:hypothetical protein n=1 Tax=Paenibacillus sp. TAB 01 TaxID=3368988 RepID=UPI00375324EB